jgi:hypothetical protein
LVTGAFFEDVSPHLFEWSWRMAPLGRPGYVLFRAILAPAHRYLDIRHHAGSMSLGAVTYVSGERDKGVRPQDTRSLADLAGGRYHIVAGAEHLGAIKIAGDEVIGLALDTFQRAEEHERFVTSSGRSFRRAALPLGGERSRVGRCGRRLQAPSRHERP